MPANDLGTTMKEIYHLLVEKQRQAAKAVAVETSQEGGNVTIQSDQH